MSLRYLQIYECFFHHFWRNLMQNVIIKLGTICKYKWLIISVSAFVLGRLKWLRGTVGGRKIGKNLQIWLPSKEENANICKIDFPVLCTFTLFNASFCTFLQSLWSEQGMNLLCSLVMLIVISNLFWETHLMTRFQRRKKKGLV